MKWRKIFSTEGKYDRFEYNLTGILIRFGMIGLAILAYLCHAFIIPAIFIGLVLIYIDIAATIKRLHDLGRSEDEFIKLFIPFVGYFLDMSLTYQLGEDEKNQEFYRDYQIQQYEKKYPREKNPEDIYRKFR